MRVLFLRSNPVNPDSRVEKEAEALLDAGIDIEIFCWDRESNYFLRKEIKVIGSHTVNIYRVGICSVYGAGFKSNLLPLLVFQFAIIGFLVKYHKRYDVIHACDFDTAFVSFYLSKLYKMKFVYDIFDYYVDSFSVPKILRRIIMKLDTNVINGASAVIVCTEERIKQLGNIKQKTIIVIHNVPKMPKKFEIFSDKVSDNRISIVYVGILNEGRMIPELLDIISKNINVELHIAGYGKYEGLVENYSRKYENIFYYGKISYKSALNLENQCDVMIALYDPQIPNHKYAAPNKYYEASMLKKPLIMVNGTGMSNLDGVNTINYSKDSLKQCVNDINKLKSMNNNELSWAVMAKRLCNLYDELK